MRHLPVHLRACALTCACAFVVTTSTALAAPPALDYADQKTSDAVAPTFIHSYIVTTGGGNVRDDKFADMVAKHVTNYNELVFAFMQCTGGGMFDELTAKGFQNMAMTAAARHDQPSIALKGDAPAVQSTYNWPYAPKAGSAAPVSQKDAATFARANDYAGVMRPMTALPAAVKQRTDPQYLATNATADAIKLHTNSGVNAVNNNKYLSIVWGGANQNLNDILTNGTTVATMTNNMVAAGYVPAEVRQLTTGGVFPTTYAGMANAWKALGAASTNTTQVFFWSSWGHGTSMLDAAAKKKFKDAQAAKKGVAFDTSFSDDAASQAFFANFTDAYNYWTAEGQPNLLPYFEIDSEVALSGVTVDVNGVPLPLLGFDAQDLYDDGSDIDYTYRFGIDSALFASISAGTNSIEIDYASGPAVSDLDFLSAGFTLGDGFNGITVPEPSTGLLILAVGAFTLRKRRAL